MIRAFLLPHCLLSPMSTRWRRMPVWSVGVPIRMLLPSLKEDGVCLNRGVKSITSSYWLFSWGSKPFFLIPQIFLSLSYAIMFLLSDTLIIRVGRSPGSFVTFLCPSGIIAFPVIFSFVLCITVDRIMSGRMICPDDSRTTMTTIFLNFGFPSCNRPWISALKLTCLLPASIIIYLCTLPAFLILMLSLWMPFPSLGQDVFTSSLLLYCLTRY